jgi:succinate dehydrogenase / fumarate reductase flavoprotein subunit
MKLEAKAPPGPLAEKWTRHLGSIRLVAPHNKRRYEVLVVGTGLAAKPPYAQVMKE